MAFRGTGVGPAFGGSAPIFSLRREIDRLFDDAFVGGRGSTWSPAIDVRETDRELALDIELPGIDPKNVELSVDNGVMTIRGEKRAERKEGDEEKYHVVERSYGAFLRSFQLPPGIDDGQINAEFSHGVLTVRIPKAALPQPRKIPIGSGAQREQQVAGTPAQSSGRESGRAQSGRATNASAQSGNRMAAGDASEKSK